MGFESKENSTVQGTEPTGALGSLSFVPLIEKQVLNPVEEHWILSRKAGVIRSPSNEAKAYGGSFFGEPDDYWNVRKTSQFNVSR